LAKAIYGNQFDWIVQRANDAMRPTTAMDSSRIIGILDIFGFEIFQANSFEQLCINFANEKLQQHFNENTFKLEEELYRSEGVPFEPSNYIDNQAVLDLIEKKTSGMLVLLDEELKFPRSTDETFLSKLVKTHAGNARFEERVKGKKTQFILKHYAGNVAYEV
jgi:myosin heavy subunit